ncbi:MAG: DUF362 domain-containing protein [Syntrophaceae bacterium]|nr:DUF362 domain-containing protein [Syntrophaceae bacterium]
MNRTASRWARVLLPLFGFLSLLWFLVRVIPKPSRATYPCMRVAFPAASAFVVWLVGLGASASLLCKARKSLRESRFRLAGVCTVAAAVTAWAGFSGSLTPTAFMGQIPPLFAQATPDTPNAPIGTAKGVNPGRVVWVHDPAATDWNGPGDGYSWQPSHTSQAVVDTMMSKAVRWLAGRPTDAGAWDALFRYTNLQKGAGDRGYQAGEKIVIKLNLTLCYVSSQSNPSSRSIVALNRYPNNAGMTNPQLVLALLRQLVNAAGVSQADIFVGDPVNFFPQEWYDYLHAEFPNVVYLDHYPFAGRTQVQLSGTPFYWSTPAADGKVQDYLPQPYVDAAYLIDFSVLKSHERAGITLSAKNHFGSLVRSPVGDLRGVHYNYYDLHTNIEGNQPGRGRYRTLVDLMGHEGIGRKTLLYLVDALYGGKGWSGTPYRWNMPPFNGDWPSSLFASQDPVAIDSVGFDFLLAEWPAEVSVWDGLAQDYLHEAALADSPPSGTVYDPERDGTRMASLGVHEHWDNVTNKQYTRNLGTGAGIELISSITLAARGDFDGDCDVDGSDLASLIADPGRLGIPAFAANFGKSTCP